MWPWCSIHGVVGSVSPSLEPGWTFATALTNGLWQRWHCGPYNYSFEKAMQLLPGFLGTVALAFDPLSLSKLKQSVDRSMQTRTEASGPQSSWLLAGSWCQLDSHVNKPFSKCILRPPVTMHGVLSLWQIHEQNKWLRLFWTTELWSYNW